VIGGCWLKRNEEENPCDIWMIKAVSMHDYKCTSKYYHELYEPDGELSYQKDLISRVKEVTGDEWDDEIADWVETTPVWLTETTCDGDVKYKDYPIQADTGKEWKDPWDYGKAPYDQQCMRATGQLPESHGEGLINYLIESPTIERYAWFGGVVGADYGDTYVG